MSDARKKTFSIIPTAEEIDSLERDLRFYPSPVTEPSVLSQEQVDAFNNDGWLSPNPLFYPAEADENRLYFDELLEKVMKEGGDSYSISSAHLKYGRVYDLLTHPRIVERVGDLLGENVVGFGSHYFCKMPGDGKAVAWHQDASYWPLSPSKTITVWLAIDDVDEGNACMRVIPGSHKLGHLTYRESDSVEGNVLDQTVDNAEQYGEPVNVVLPSGYFSIHSDLILHGSKANESNRRRCGLTLRYCAAEVRAELGWNAKGVLVRGVDNAGHWGNPKRPDED